MAENGMPVIAASAFSSHLTAGDLLSRLASGGWARVSASDFGSRWSHSRSGQEVIVPNGVTPSNFEWDGVIRRIAQGEGVSEAAVRDSIRFVAVDIARIRAVGDTRFDSIPLFSFERLVEAGKRMLRASATTSQARKGVIGSTYSIVGDKIAKQARVGLTTSGSYVVPILMPLSEEPPNTKGMEPLPGEPLERLYEPPERRVIRTLAESLNAISQIVEDARDPRPEAIQHLVDSGGSQESVKALRHAIGSPGVERVDVGFAWGAAFRVPERLERPVEFLAEADGILEVTERKLRRAPRSNGETLTGVVMSHSHDEDPNWEHVSLQTIRRGRPTAVRIRYPADRLEEIQRWYRTRETVIVAGNVESVPGKPARIWKPDVLQALADQRIIDVEDGNGEG